MSEELISFSKESVQDPVETKRYIQETYNDIFPVINAVAVADDAVDLFNRWEKEFSNGGKFSILNALIIFNDLKLVSPQGYENTLLLLDYASRHGVIELDCSMFVGDAQPQQQDLREEQDIGITKDETIHQNLMLTIYKQQLYKYFGSTDAVPVPPELIQTQLEVANKLRDCTYEQLLKLAGIDTTAHSEDSLSEKVERYIKNFSDTDDWQFDLKNIRNLLKQSVMLFVQAAIDAGKYSPDRWHVIAENLWQDIAYRLGGIENICSLLDSPPPNSALPAEKFLQTLKSGGGYSEWENAVSHSYFDLKKHILLQTQTQTQSEIEDYADWFIHAHDKSDKWYFADLLNKRVLDLWNLTQWSNEFEKPIQYLRSESGEFVVTSWHHPDGDLMGDRGNESCYYLIANDGVVIIREHNEILNLSNEIDLNAAAMTIIKDVMGEYDMHKISQVFYVNLSSGGKRNQEFIQGSITRERLVNAMVNEWIVNCYCAPDEDDDPPEVKRKEFESMTNEELLESTGCDEIYTIQSFVGQYQRIADEYMQVFNASPSGTKGSILREKSFLVRVMDFLRRVRNKIRQLFNSN